MKARYSLTLVLVMLAAFPAAAAPAPQDPAQEVIVTATRMETPTSEVASSTTVITGDELAGSQADTVYDALRGVEGLDVVRSGGAGKRTSVFIRGAESRHTLVLIDGVEANDPSSAGRTFDFANLSADNIERIEVIRGPQSILYGSDAIGGVINIITKKGAGAPRASLTAEGGSFSTFSGRADLAGAAGSTGYSVSVSALDTEGISSANEKDGNSEKDGYENRTVSARLDFTPAENWSAGCTFRYTDTYSEIDSGGGPGGDDLNNVGDASHAVFGAHAGFSLLDDAWEQKISVSLADHDRQFRNDPDEAHPDEFSRDSYDGSLLTLDWQNTVYAGETHTIIAGIEYEEETAESDYYAESGGVGFTSTFSEESSSTTGLYFSDQVSLKETFFPTLGIRFDDHNRSGSETTYRLGSAYISRETGTTVRATYGTGFKAPSLFQLYSEYGSQDLQPEESTGWDAGIEQSFREAGLLLGATYFNNDFENLIDFDMATSTYGNVASAASSGLELFAVSNATDRLTLTFTYTNTDTEDGSTGEELFRRPKHKADLDIRYSFPGKGQAGISVAYTGERDDRDGSARITLPSYTLVDISGSYKARENIRIHGRIENLLDEDYEEANGYGTPGISAFIGVTVTR